MQQMQMGGGMQQMQMGQQPDSLNRQNSWKVPRDQWYENRMGPGEIGKQNLGNFIKKVYAILTFQMAITVAFCVGGMFWPPLQNALISFMRIRYGTLLIFIPAIISLCCLQCNKANYPLNYMLLICFTVLMSISIAGICALYQAAGMGILILQAFVITMGTFTGLSLYAMYSGQDFSWMGGMLSMGLFGMIAFSFFGMIFGFSGGIFYSMFGVFLFCGFILYDTSRVLRIYGPDDALIASIELYLDILNLFLYILEILSRGNSD